MIGRAFSRITGAAPATIVFLLAGAAPAIAQVSMLSRTGPSAAIFPGSGSPANIVSDVAYDPKRGVFLTVAIGDRTVWGLFVDPQGNPSGAAFRIDSIADASVQAVRARLVYSADVSNGAGGRGGFLVVWEEASQLGSTVRGRLVAHPGTLVGTEKSLPGGSRLHVAYSATSRVFMVVSRTATTLSVARVGIDGQPIGQPGSFPSGGDGFITSIAWNAVLDEFGVFSEVGTERGAFLRFGTNGALLRRTDISLGTSPRTDTLAFNTDTGNFVVAWQDFVLTPTPSFRIFAVEISGTGDELARGKLSTIRTDWLSISYSPVTQTFLLLVVDFPFALRALELTGHGAPMSALTSVAPRGFPVSAAARLDVGAWLAVGVVVFSPNQLESPVSRATPIITTSVGSGPPWTLGIDCDDPTGSHGFDRDQCINGVWFPDVSAPTVAAPPPPVLSDESCSIPDPFVTIGGGRCSNGNWYPPGKIIPAAPAPPTPPGPPSPGACVIPDPFVALGGGTCANGNWYPPGMPIPGTTPAPPTPPPPPPAPGGCATPDPFVSLGGGTCANGDWFPPGMPIPGVPSPPPPSPSPTGCVGSDPFIGLQGLAGVCINGDWIPTELFQGAATVQFHPEAGGFWALHLDDGRVFVPMGGLALAFQTNGRRVTISGKVRIDLPSTPRPVIEVLSIS